MSMVVGFDIGGTNSRAVIARVTAEGKGNRPGPRSDSRKVITRKAGSKRELQAFIRELCGSLPDSDGLLGAAVALAGPVIGPVIGHPAATMTNWPEPREITLQDFVEWGLPPDRIILLNDMEAGCYGLMAHLGTGDRDSRCFEPLEGCPAFCHEIPHEISHELPHEIPRGNRVFIAPGTGLGAAGIIEVNGKPQAPPSIHPIAAELQNTPMPVLGAEDQIVVDWLRRERQIEHPSWDDVVSGRGLVGIYRALRAAEPADRPDVTLDAEDHAAAIASAGAMGRDPVARRALSVFYASLGRFCQLMALGFQAFGGVFIGGASTIKNRDFIQGGPGHRPLLDAFLSNPTQRSLLARFPVYLVGQDDLNLDGTLWPGHFL